MTASVLLCISTELRGEEEGGGVAWPEHILFLAMADWMAPEWAVLAAVVLIGQRPHVLVDGLQQEAEDGAVGQLGQLRRGQQLLHVGQQLADVLA